MQSFSESRQVFQYYQDALAGIRKRVLSMDNNSLLNTDEQVLIERLLADTELEPPEKDLDRKIEGEPTKDVRTVRDLQFDEERLETIDMVIVEVPLVPKATNKLVLTLQPSSWTILLGGRVKAVFDDYNHILRFSTYPGDVENQLRVVESKIDNLRADIEKQTPPFRAQVTELAKSQREKVARSRGEIAQKMQSLGIELKSRPGAVEPVRVQVKREIEVLRTPPPKKQEQPERHLTPQAVASILELIEQAGRGFEIVPGTYSKLEEEDLRNIIVGYLNAVIDSDVATGETFSKAGKSDIRITVGGKSVLVAECKYWGGKGLYGDTIQQLFRYTPWRHSVGIMVTFSRNKGLTNVVSEADGAIQSHPSYRSGFCAKSVTHRVSVHEHPDDADKTIEVHHLFFNLYSST